MCFYFLSSSVHSVIWFLLGDFAPASQLTWGNNLEYAEKQF